jgi:hypothetical protein
MKMLDQPRKAKEEVRYQFHIELTMEEIREIRQEVGIRGSVAYGSTSHAVLTGLTDRVPQG